jgi:hypothetical protein
MGRRSASGRAPASSPDMIPGSELTIVCPLGDVAEPAVDQNDVA